ncbi:hypothetical protein V8B97DRAFT_2110217 [Scleroderma yunnanense]
MPRRPRPANRVPPKHNAPAAAVSRAQVASHSGISLSNPHRAKQARPRAIDFLSESGSDVDEEASRSGSEEGDLVERGVSGSEEEHCSSDVRGGMSSADSDGASESSRSEEEDDDGDADAPWISHWVDDETPDEDLAQEDDSEGTDEDGEDVQVRSLKNNLSTLPLGVLRKAQQSLAQAEPLSDSDISGSESEPSDDDNEPRTSLAHDKEKGKPKELPKRPHKHAPTEISSKRPITRRRTVVEDSTPKPRDPRFMHVSGAFAPDKFRQQYGSLLSDLHTNELTTLRENYKRARKVLTHNTPRDGDVRAAREAEVKRLELAVKRAESAVNRDTREKVEADALRKVTLAEKEKRKQGKGAWFMKRSEKRDLLNKARYDAIAASGGNQAVKKAIEKKQRKISQKEKKSRPFSSSGGAITGSHQGAGGSSTSRTQDVGRKRRAGSGDSMNRGAKRRKVA